jgi:hypothetical protein
MSLLAQGFLSHLFKMRTRTKGKKITTRPRTYCAGVLFFAGRYDRLEVSRWGEVAGHLNDLNSRGSETIRLPTESITRER